MLPAACETCVEMCGTNGFICFPGAGVLTVDLSLNFMLISWNCLIALRSDRSCEGVSEGGEMLVDAASCLCSCLKKFRRPNYRSGNDIPEMLVPEELISLTVARRRRRRRRR